MDERRCRQCRWCWQDDRQGNYRRAPMWFCRQKGWIFSRCHRIGEGARIDPDAPACEKFQTRESTQ